jgi:integrase
MAVISVACGHGQEQGSMAQNPVQGVKRVRRQRSQPKANRPWTRGECRAALDNLPVQLILPIALAMFTGLRQGDILTLRKNAVREGHIWRVTDKTGQEVSLPVHPRLAASSDRQRRMRPSPSLRHQMGPPGPRTASGHRSTKR